MEIRIRRRGVGSHSARIFSFRTQFDDHLWQELFPDVVCDLYVSSTIERVSVPMITV